jgi:hypothetical protein
MLICLFAGLLTNHGDAGLFNKLVGIYPELAAHERAVDVLIDLFKKDQVHDKSKINDYTSSFLFLAKEIYNSAKELQTLFMSVYFHLHIGINLP